MFTTIYKHELKYWFKKPAFYIYAAIFFILALFLSAGAAGIFDFLTVTTGSALIVNSPISVTGILNSLTVFIFFLFPSIIGMSIYRDFKSDMHTILYSYPFTKVNYLFAKFFSGITVVSIIVLIVAIGTIIGFRLPGTNASLVGPFDIMSYVSAYFVYVLPNILLFGAIVFAVVTFTRNVAAGFIVVIILMFAQGLLETLFSDQDNRFLTAILDPFGSSASNYYTRYWTIAEQNELHLPIKGVILYNRLLWLGIASIIFGMVYKLFSFSQNAMSLNFRKHTGVRATKSNFGGITKINLPKVQFDYSFIQNLKTTWKLSNVDFKYIIKSWPFISIVLVGLILMLISLSEIGNLFGTATLPVTWKMLGNGGTFGIAIMVSTFLYAGMLVHRGKMANTSQLVDTTPVPNWTLLLSKFVALLKMQFVLLTVILVSGMLFQIYNGYYDFELGHYFKELYIMRFLQFAIWAMLALFIQSLIRNPYLGLFILLIILIGFPLIFSSLIEQDIFKFNQGPSFRFSDMNGYGNSLPKFFVYKLYWFIAGVGLLILAGLFRVRGLPNSFKERLSIFKDRFVGPARMGFLLALIAFVTIGSTIYYNDNIVNESFTSKEREQQTVDWEKIYKKYQNAPQPRIVAVKAAMNIFPKALNFDASGTYTLVNKTNTVIDSIFLNHNNYPSHFKFNKETHLVSEDTVFHFDIYQLQKGLQPGDTLKLDFTVKNEPNTLLKDNSPVLENGTFINNMQIFPSLGYSGGELSDDETRKKYGLPPNDLKPHPSDSTALGNHYISKDADWIDFEATVSTSEDQIAIAPGYLQKEWTENGRRYFHYKMDSKILNFYAFNSARYAVKKDKWNDVNLEIYYHKPHTYNLERMMDGMKASLAYNSENFSPYQHKQARIIEFPRTSGSFAQSFPNTIPFSEGVGFIADVDETEAGGVDYPFAITVHEVAHQWWAHQVIGADVLGATMLSESLSEYVSLKVLEHQQGKSKMRKFLKKALDDYLTSRSFERKREKPLMYNDGQGYIRYQKGSLVFYAISDYIGEDVLKNALKQYVEKVKFQEAPYTTSIEMVDYIREATPDSLKYTIKDMFETITLYNNRVVNVSSKALDNGKYEVDIEFEVSKYRNDDTGNKYYGEKVGDTLSYKTESMRRPLLSVPLADYIDIGIFGEANDDDDDDKEIELYLKKHKITAINNKVTIVVDKKPVEVGIDPYNKLIDTKSDDNRRRL
ncbi:ABC transporter permease/M1 family aminopeptidase [Changchengzhania lutea]|uniref:ABC transporter permease/M1 family aminopeptidase n=1 Tax=Changchengzhania lutea TaxID=2049305 RepID=UPI00115DD60D|nr:M1 family aminopeptidase [Changchengzhania lutea]